MGSHQHLHILFHRVLKRIDIRFQILKSQKRCFEFPLIPEITTVYMTDWMASLAIDTSHSRPPAAVINSQNPHTTESVFFP